MAWMVYGANGYTGRLIAELAVRTGQRPVLAGRSADKLAALAAELGLDHVVVDLTDAGALRDALDEVDLVVHCAGPFGATAAPMVDACLLTGTDYLDITGEIDVFEAIFARHDDAVTADVVLLPGAGFDVVPTDCVAAMLAAELPDATSLDLAFIASGGISPGTLKTAVEGAGRGRARINGVLTDVPMAHRQRTAAFPSGQCKVTAIPWGDLATAYRSTGIPDITTYTALPGGELVGRGGRLLAPVLRQPVVQRAGKALIQRLVGGPDEQRRAASRTEVWGEVRNAAGRAVSVALTVPNTYTFTADAVLAAVRKVLGGGVSPGAHTPSSAFGANFVLELDGVTRHGG